MAYRVHVYEDPRAFLEAAGAFLYANEARHCLILGVSERLAAPPPKPESANRFWLATESGAPALAAMLTPPFPISVSTGPTEAARQLARELAGTELNGVGGPADTAEAFAQAWGAARLRQRLLLHRLDAVELRELSPGCLRAATPADAGLLAAWADDFQEEADASVRIPGTQVAGEKIGAGELFVWEDEGRPVSMTSWGRPTRNSASINMVYTPPESRKRGYASSAVAELSGRLLAEGRAYCTLFTDRANPTANKIYARIGYQPIGDRDDWSFGPLY